jgi:hypothetical protein
LYLPKISFKQPTWLDILLQVERRIISAHIPLYDAQQRGSDVSDVIEDKDIGLIL